MTDERLFGDRNDPHVQARAAREAPLLLHSLTLFREVFEVIFRHRKITTVVEIGVESGKASSVYLDLGAADVHCVDPAPSAALRASIDAEPHLHLVDEPSPGVLTRLPIADLYIVDGDHNYAVVRQEVDWITRNAPDAVIVLHDVLWPCSRRDLYYEPSPLPAEDRHPWTTDGATVWHDGVTPAGFVGNEAYTVAAEAGGERNGVLTAVEDAIAEAADKWNLEIVPAVFGLGVAVRSDGDAVAELFDDLRPFTDSGLLQALENNRIALYSRVLQMQYEAVAHADHADRLAEAVNAAQHEIRRAVDERHTLEEAMSRLRADNDTLRRRRLKNLPRALARRVRRAVRR